MNSLDLASVANIVLGGMKWARLHAGYDLGLHYEVGGAALVLRRFSC